MFEAVGAHSVGKMSDEDLHELECVACPSAGSCGGQFTANTMACVSEAIGLALPGSAGAPAPYEFARRLCRGLGPAVMELLRLNLRPRDIVTRKALENAATVVAASGGSTNAGLHLPAIAHEAGIDFDLHDVGEIFKRTPYIADLKPGGRYVAKDLYDVGGVPVLMKALLDGGYLHGDCLTVTGKTIAENLRDVVFPAGPGRGAADLAAALADRRRRRPQGQPRAARGDREGRRHAAAAFRGPARCFDCEEDAFAAVEARALQGGRRDRHPLRGAARRAGHARDAVDDGGALRPGRRRQGRADHRRPLLGRDPRLLHRPCRAGGGGRRSDRPARDGDMITIDADSRDDRCRPERGRAWPSDAAPGRRAATTTSRGRCGNTPRPSATPKRAR